MRKTPFGYKRLGDGTLIRHVGETAILKEVRRLRNLNGFSPAYIAGWLNAQNKLNRRKRWTPEAVREVLAPFVVGAR